MLFTPSALPHETISLGNPKRHNAARRLGKVRANHRLVMRAKLVNIAQCSKLPGCGDCGAVALTAEDCDSIAHQIEIGHCTGAEQIQFSVQPAGSTKQSVCRRGRNMRGSLSSGLLMRQNRWDSEAGSRGGRNVSASIRSLTVRSRSISSRRSSNPAASVGPSETDLR